MANLNPLSPITLQLRGNSNVPLAWGQIDNNWTSIQNSVNALLSGGASGQGLQGASVSVLAYGADSTGAADSSTAFANAAATGLNVVVPVGTFAIQTNCDVSGATSLVFAGGVIKPSSGITFTCNEVIAQPHAQIFDISAGGTVHAVEP